MTGKKKAISLFMIGVFSFSFAACSDAGNDLSDGGAPQEPAIEYTDYSFFTNGRSEYTLLLPQEPTNAEIMCASELNALIGEATGTTLPIVYEGSQVIDKFISIGKTERLAASMVEVDYAKLGTSGYVVRTVEDDVYIAGEDPGVIYGAYEFLEKEFNYHYYTDNVYEIETGVREKKLVDFNAEEIPAFEYRQLSYGFERYASQDSMYAYRMRLNSMSPTGVGGVAGSWHNFFAAIPKETYQADHKNWYSPDGTQLCLTRDRTGLATEMKNLIVKMLEEDPTLKYIHIGQEDTTTWCTCDTCTETIAQYSGYNSSTYILFMNEVSDLLQPYLDEQGLEVYLTMFAYHRTQEAPVAWDESAQSYRIISEDLHLRDNVYVLYAPIEADYYEPFTDSVNANTYKDFAGWSLISGRLLLWTYCETFGNYMFPFDNFNSMKQNFQLAEELGVFWYYNQAQWDNYNSSGFSRLKSYLSAKLQWDPDADIRQLTSDFCNYYYGEAADIMMEILDSYKTWRAYCYYELGLRGEVYAIPDDGIYWPYGLVKEWLGNIDEAYTLIQKYETTDTQTYRRLNNAIVLDSLSFRYITITYHANYYSAEQLLTLKREFKRDAQTLNVTLWKEGQTRGGDINELYESWEIS